MLICKKDNAHYINIHLEIIPSFIEVIEGDNVYKFSLVNINYVHLILIIIKN